MRESLTVLAGVIVTGIFLGLLLTALLGPLSASQTPCSDPLDIGCTRPASTALSDGRLVCSRCVLAYMDPADMELAK